MNQLARCDQLPERARYGAILAARDYPNFSGLNGWVLACFFCFVFFATPSRSINAPEKQKERGQYPAILKALLVNNLYMFGSRIATANLSGPLISYVHIHIN